MVKKTDAIQKKTQPFVIVPIPQTETMILTPTRAMRAGNLVDPFSYWGFTMG